MCLINIFKLISKYFVKILTNNYGSTIITTATTTISSSTFSNNNLVLRKISSIFLFYAILNINSMLVVHGALSTKIHNYMNADDLNSLSTSFHTNTVLNTFSSNSVTSTLATHYQVITICNSLPSILKCQNRQHYLILHRVIYGLSNTTGLSGQTCVPQANCMVVDETDEFNCTGSNMCVFYPTDRFIANCKNIESNLTQIHITCLSLLNFKRYYAQMNKKFEFMSNNKSSGGEFHNISTLEDATKPNRVNYNNNNNNYTQTKLTTTLNTTKNLNLKSNNSTNFNTLLTEKNSIIFISVIVASGVIAIILFLFAYYKIRLKQRDRLKKPADSSESTGKSSDTENNSKKSSTIKVIRKYLNILSCHIGAQLRKLRKLITEQNQTDNRNGKPSTQAAKKTNHLSPSNEHQMRNNLNEKSPKPNGKFYSIPMNLKQSEQSNYENENYCFCTCSNKQEKSCNFCQNPNKYLMLNRSNSNKSDKDYDKVSSRSSSSSNSSLKRERPKKSYDTTATIKSYNDMHDVPTLGLTSNTNYALYDIPEVDESEDDYYRDDVEYYYNRTNLSTCE